MSTFTHVYLYTLTHAHSWMYFQTSCEVSSKATQANYAGANIKIKLSCHYYIASGALCVTRLRVAEIVPSYKAGCLILLAEYIP